MLFNCIKTIFDYSSRSRLQMKMSIQYAVLLVLFLVFRLGVNGAVAVGNRINDGLITEQGMSEQADIQLEKELEVNTTEKWEMAEADTDTEQRKKDTMAEIQKRQVELVEREQKVAQRENKVAEREAEVEQKENHIPDMKAVAEKWEVIQEILDGNFIHLSKKEIKRLRLEEKSMSDLNQFRKMVSEKPERFKIMWIHFPPFNPLLAGVSPKYLHPVIVVDFFEYVEIDRNNATHVRYNAKVIFCSSKNDVPSHITLIFRLKLKKLTYCFDQSIEIDSRRLTSCDSFKSYKLWPCIENGLYKRYKYNKTLNLGQ